MENITQTLNGQFLSDSLAEFPFANQGEFRILDKGKTGCGGTSLVKSTTDKIGGISIILMPSVASVISKEQQYFGDERAYFIHGSIKPSFDKESRRLTVFATYDSYFKIKSYLGDDQFKCRLVIDEYHTITRDSFRDVMVNLLAGINHYKSVTFMSATPDELLINAVQAIYTERKMTRITYQWNEGKFIQLMNIEKDLENKLCHVINTWTRKHTSNLYLMLNNLERIDRIVAKCGLDESQYNILCSNYNDHHNDGIDGINNNRKRINFLTAAGFEGCDILDDQGQIICAVDLHANNTIFDAQTIIQMMGRCRGSKSTPIILYYHSKYKRTQVFDINARYAELKYKEENIIDYLDDKDVICVNNKHIVNPIALAQVDRFKMKLEKLHNYNVFKKYLEDNGIRILPCTLDIESTNLNRIRSFKECCQMYERGIQFMGKDLNKLVKDAYDILGVETIKALKYNKDAIKKAIKYKKEDIDIKDCLNLINGKAYTAKMIAERIKQANIIMGTEFNELTRDVNRTLEEIGFKTRIKQEKVLLSGNTIISEDEFLSIAEDNLIEPVGNKQKICKELKNKGIDITYQNDYWYEILDGGHKIAKKSTWMRAHPYISLAHADADFLANKLPKSSFDYDNLTPDEFIYQLEQDTTPITYEVKRPTPSDYVVSYATRPGVKVSHPMFTTTTLKDSIAPTRPSDKANQYLISEGYSTTAPRYSRNEENFNATDLLVLDVDNGVSIEEFNEYVKKYYGNALHWIAKTYSYTDDKPKYRVFFPLSDTMYFKDINDTRAWKKAKFNMFDNVQDPQCQMWIFAPLVELEEYGQEYTLLDTNYIREYMEWWKICEKAQNTNIINLTQEKEIINQNMQYHMESSIDKEIDRINEAEEGERDMKIFQVVMRLKNRPLEQILQVYNGIYDSEKKEMFESKLKYKLKITI